MGEAGAAVPWIAMSHNPMPSAPAQTTRDSVLKTDHLTKQVSSPEGPLTIMQEVSLDIAAGESVAVVGPSGAEKSTLPSRLAGLVCATSGRKKFAGTDVS